MIDSEKTNISEFRALYEKEYGRKIDLAEAERILSALAGLLSVVSESRRQRTISS